jgi:hypothetical protein
MAIMKQGAETRRMPKLALKKDLAKEWSDIDHVTLLKHVEL